MATIVDKLFVHIPLLTCKVCAETIIKSQDGVEKIRAKVFVVRDQKVYAVCKGCNTEIELPLTKSDVKTVNAGPPLILRK